MGRRANCPRIFKGEYRLTALFAAGVAYFLLLAIRPALGSAPTGTSSALTSVMVQEFEKPSLKPTVWVVNIPNENASVQLSQEHPHDGKQCLKLHYQFVGKGQFQYLGIPNKVRINAPIHKLRFWLYGDNSNCSYGVQVTDASGETHQYSKNTGQGGIIDFTGWKEVVIDLDSGHETWGGDKNGKIDYPITAITFSIGQPTDQGKLLPAKGELYFDSLSVDSERSADETLGGQIAVVSPDYCSEVKGDTRIAVVGAGLQERDREMLEARRRLRRRFDRRRTVRSMPTATARSSSRPRRIRMVRSRVRISGKNSIVTDNCYLQLYNKGASRGTKACPRILRRRPRE